MVRLDVSAKASHRCGTSKFQFLVVRLDAKAAEVTAAVLSAFQFLVVRLEVFVFQYTVFDNIFQFLVVRLEVNRWNSSKIQ